MVDTDTDLVSYKEPNPLIFFQPLVVVSIKVLEHILTAYLTIRMSITKIKVWEQ